MLERDKQIDQSVVAKAGLWYTVCNFAFRGLAFITTPIFTRLMSKAEIGYFSNFSSWTSILIVLTSFDFAQSIIRSKLEHKDDMDSYIWSILSLSTIWTLLVYAIVCLFPDFFTDLLQVEIKHIHVMFLYFLSVPAYTMLITKHRAFYKYKMFVLLTGIATVLALFSSVVLVVLMEDKITGRIVGHYAPYIAIGVAIYMYLAIKGKRIKVKYWKYASVLCLPLIPHVLSMNLLGSSDKIIITRVCGMEYTAIYGIAYSCYHIATILLDSLNKAWAPWLLDNLNIENYSSIKDVSKKYVGIFSLLIILILFLAPEIIYLLGGKQYKDAIRCIPPLISSCMVQLIYTMYVNVEFFKKKTFGVSVATVIATAFNIVLNLIFIPLLPEWGFVIAAYTTLAGYLLLFALHYLLVRKLRMQFVFDVRFLLIDISLILVISLLANLLYNHLAIRYIVIFIYVLCLGRFMFNQREKLFSLLRGQNRGGSNG